LFNVFAGLGPGGLREIRNVHNDVTKQCVSGSSHGGKGDQGIVFKADVLYDEENITSLLGGSGGGTMSLSRMIFPLLKFAQTIKRQFRFYQTHRFVCSFVCLFIYFTIYKYNDKWK